MLVEMEGITKRFGKRTVLKNFSVQLQPGIYGLLGTNGAGKTTLLKIFMGILSADAGQIRVDGQSLERLGVDFLSHLGYLPQSPLFYKNFIVEEFLRYISTVKGIPARMAAERIRELLQEVNLTMEARKKIGALSGGMRQRLGIAQAMLNDPDVLILDEPTAGLDPRERIRFRNLIGRMAGRRIVLVATHIVSDVECMANRILLLHEGELLRNAEPADLTAELAGRVWELELAAEDVPEELLHQTISNLTREQNGLRLRILADEKPHPEARPIWPNLEEVFLYHCGEDRL